MTRFAIRNIIARKLFHILVVVMFVPAFFADASMLSLSYGVALSVFCLVECIRALAIPPFGAQIADFMKAFIDHRDGGRTILTHSYLLVGCALPLWLSTSSSGQAQHQHALAANAGIIALGIGDAMGAAVGSVFGKRRLIGSKTLEDAFHVAQLSLLLLGVVVTSVLETCTAQIDNLVLPLFFFAVCNLVACHL
uniref:dolichol kinase n=1 Tax=Globisporangium ultimum (strain ATCC 200006 / CBS 805.95 / DAOM BR144) TaxID=431595 RepID=K3X936_GLOUD